MARTVQTGVNATVEHTLTDDVVDELGVREETEYVRTIVKNGTGADRQLKVWHETGDLKAVMDYVISETEHGLQL